VTGAPIRFPLAPCRTAEETPWPRSRLSVIPRPHGHSWTRRWTGPVVVPSRSLPDGGLARLW